MGIQILSFLFFSAIFCQLIQGRHLERGFQSNRNRNSIAYPEEDTVKCITDLGRPGRCVDVRTCHGAKRIIAAGNHPIRCGWSNQFAPKVCCHPDQVSRRRQQQPNAVVYPDTRWNTIDTERRELPNRHSYVGNSGRGLPNQRPYGGNSERGLPNQRPYGGNSERGLPNQRPYGGNSERGLPNQHPYGENSERGLPNQRPYGGNSERGLPNQRPYGGNSGRRRGTTSSRITYPRSYS